MQTTLQRISDLPGGAQRGQHKQSLVSSSFWHFQPVGQVELLEQAGWDSASKQKTEATIQNNTKAIIERIINLQQEKEEC